MADPRYSFSPLERRGVLLGLQAGQLATIGAATAVALVLHGSVGGPGGLLLTVTVLAAGLAGAVWTRSGQPLGWWALAGIRWLCRRGGRTRLSAAPLDGHGPRAGDPACRPSRKSARSDKGGTSSGMPMGIDLIERSGRPFTGGYAVIRDRAAGSVAAVVPVNGRSLSLLDPAEQAQCLEAWRTVLAGLARPGTPVSRLQWVQRTSTGGGAPPADLPPPAAGLPPSAAGGSATASGSYAQLVDDVSHQVRRHDTWLVLVVGGDRRSRAPTRMETLDRELRFLEGQLRQAGLEPGLPLDGGQLRSLVRTDGMAVKEDWSALRIDRDWHATYWVAEWPRLEVGPAFLQPLLVSGSRTAVSVVMAPVPTDRALREVRSARTADLADAALRERAGFLSSARREREAEGVARREGELAEGHAEYRFSGYVTVSAGSEDGLAVACSEVEHAAHAARLELRRLYGRQAEAFTWTRPLGRGLR